MKVLSTIQARMTSSRLPGKSMAPILGKPMLELLIERLKRAKTVDQIAVATTDHPSDDVIEELTVRLGVGCFRGSMNDVLDRVLKTARKYEGELLVQITGDCPLIDPDIVDQCVHSYFEWEGKYDYVSNYVERTFPRGMDTQVYPVRILEELMEKTQDPADHEHVSLYIYEHPNEYRLGHVYAQDKVCQRTDLRLTVDTPEDFLLIKTIYERLYPQNPSFTLRDVIDLMNANPELQKINAEIQQKSAR